MRVRTSGPGEPGVYVLLLQMPTSRRLQVGRLGWHDLAAGIYAYVGSAHGPGGLRARLRHHVQGTANPRWHLDYLRQAAEPRAAVVRSAGRELECEWAARLTALRVLRSGPAGFGASDCHCRGHLFRAGPKTRAQDVLSAVGRALKPDAILDRAALDELRGEGTPARTRAR